MRKNFLDRIEKKLIVSCQALPDEPLHSSYIMGKMAKAADQAGASGIRANSVVDINEIQSETELPIIGIIKNEYENSEVFITPTLKEVREVCETGVAVVAIDATNRKRPNGEDLSEIINKAKSEFPEILFMADTATIQDAEKAEKYGFDIVGTTLYGYTEETRGFDISDNDFQHLKDILTVTNLPVIAEGKIDTPKKAKRVLEIGAHAVVTGGAITRPQEIARKFVEEISRI